MSEVRLDAVTVSDMCVDMILTGGVRPHFHQVEQVVDDYELELGGSANIFACQFAKLGGAIATVGKVGNDLLGQLILNQLGSCGVDLRFVQVRDDLKTGASVALVDVNDRAILTYPGTIDSIEYRELDPAWGSCTRHWHIASFFLLRRLRPHWPRWLAHLRSHGVTVSLDTNWDPDDRWTGLDRVLPFVDVFLPNENEALRITGTSRVADALERLSRQAPVVVVKRGTDGVVAMANGRRFALPAAEVPDVADTIGAGDNFDAGFVRAWQAGLPMEDALRWGIRCASQSLSRHGGIRGEIEGGFP